MDVTEPPKRKRLLGIEVAEWVPQGTLFEILIGNYDYSYLFMPRWPYCRGKVVDRLPPFFAVNEPLPLLLAIIMGFQHAAAMVAGIVLGPLTITAQNPDPSITAYLVGVCLIASGLGTIVHVIRFKIPWTRYYYGTGIVSVVGITTTQAAVGLTSIAAQLNEGATWNEAYGKFLGTNMVCCFITIGVSLLPNRVLRRIFPSWIAGLTVFLVGVTLSGVGITNWGGGFSCGTDGTGLCTGNGEVELPFGSIQYLGLGGVFFVTIILIECFGPPIMRNCEIILGYLIAYTVAAFVTHDGQRFVNPTALHDSPNGTFFWVHTFDLGIFPGAILPFFIAYLADAATAVGDITATEEASDVETFGPKHDERIQGGLLADGGNCLLASLATSMPVNIFAQNNGIIAFTMVASRVAGVCCGVWLFLCGVIGKIGAFFTYAPNCINGGAFTYLFGSIAVSGILVMTKHAVDRRTRFIMSVAAAVGIGVTIKPSWGTNHLWLISDTAPAGIRALQQSVTIVLSTGYVFGYLVAVVLDAILPYDTDRHTTMHQAHKHGLTSDPKHPHDHHDPAKDMDMANSSPSSFMEAKVENVVATNYSSRPAYDDNSAV